jgi:hypothetical protein
MSFGRMPYRKNEAGFARFGGRKPSPERGSRSRSRRNGVNGLPILRIGFGAAAALVLFVIVHSAVQTFSAAANVLVAR